MEKKVFSVKDGRLVIKDENISLIDLSVRRIVASTYDFLGEPIHLLPQSLIRKQPTDEELAEVHVDKVWGSYKDEIPLEQYGSPLTLGEISSSDFLAGRKSFGDKEFHLSKEELANILVLGSHYDFSLEQIVKYITPPIYPHTITVDFDGEKYYLETLKADY